MLNGKARKAAVQELREAVERHERERERVGKQSVELFDERKKAATEVIEAVETYVNRLANSPKHFKKSVTEFRARVNRFDKTVKKLEVSAAKANRNGGSACVGGVMAGTGVAAFGPTAALAVATTFGTASTGTAISTLSGAAATKAALAWLGGGALTTGGAGMAGGKALLAMAGPVGWTIGGVAITGSALYVRHRNAQLAKEASEQCVEVVAGEKALVAANREITGLVNKTKKYSAGCMKGLAFLNQEAPSDFQDFSAKDKKHLQELINHVKSLGSSISKEVAL